MNSGSLSVNVVVSSENCCIGLSCRSEWQKKRLTNLGSLMGTCGERQLHTCTQAPTAPGGYPVATVIRGGAECICHCRSPNMTTGTFPRNQNQSPSGIAAVARLAVISECRICPPRLAVHANAPLSAITPTSADTTIPRDSSFPRIRNSVTSASTPNTPSATVDI